MNKHTNVCFYRFNWAIFKAQWAMIFVALKLLLVVAHLARILG